MGLFRRRRIKRQLNAIGSFVESSYMLYVNNLSPMSFPSKDDLVNYLSEFRNENQIFALQIYRIDTYSL